jgi:DNA polymerase-1
MENKKIMLIDGNSIINRAYYGIRAGAMLSTTDGLPTNAIYGFLTILLKYLDEEKPEYICVAFDTSSPTFRHNEFETYKAQRKGMDDELAIQFPYVKQLLDAMNIKRLELPGFEADDILGTLSLEAEKVGIDVILITGDRDSMQLLSDKVRIKLPITKAGRTETEEYNSLTMEEKYGIKPLQLIDIKGLMGDSSDNIPGVAGIGEKTAYELIKRFGSIDGIYQSLSQIEKKGVKEKLENGRDMAYKCKMLATINREISIDKEVEAFTHAEYDKENLFALLKRLQFESLIEKLNLQGIQNKKDYSSHHTRIIDNIHELDIYIEEIRNSKKLTLTYILEKTDYFQQSLKLFAFDGETPICIFISEQQKEEDVLDYLKPIFEDSTIKKYGYELKNLWVYLRKKGIVMEGIEVDALLAGYVLDPSREKYSIPEIIKTNSQIDVEDITELVGKGKNHKDLSEVGIQKVADIMGTYVKCLPLAIDEMLKSIENNGQTHLFKDVEMPLLIVLGEMEFNGFKVDKEGLIKFGEELDAGILSAEASIYMHAGEQFNINSPKQLGVILFEKLGLPPIKKTKTGYSTDAEVLDELSSRHDIVKEILLFRQLMKLKSTYVEGLMAVINPEDGRIHSSFNQTITATGRISSTEPNLQNIPIRLELGRKIRRVFIPENEQFILSDADYSQIELRVLAHVAKDHNMINAFKNKMDIHTATASKVFKIPENEVTSLMRSRAKAVNFGIVYGIGDFSLSKDLGITKKEAKRYIDEYLENYSGVKKYMEDTVAFGNENGFVVTLLNRRRYLPELLSKNFNIRSFGERVAMNAPIQGSAADIIKIAMVKVYKELKQRNMKSRLILQVHDELVIETHIDEKDQVAKILKNSMETAVELLVPMTVEVDTGNNWYDAH